MAYMPEQANEATHKGRLILEYSQTEIRGIGIEKIRLAQSNWMCAKLMDTSAKMWLEVKKYADLN
jgi:hypothetical protein